jgi:hypothetical protein
MRRAQDEQVVGVGTTAIRPMPKVVDVQPAHLVAARHATAAVTLLDDGAKSGVDRAFAATQRDWLPVPKQEVAHRRVTGQVVTDVRRQHRAQVQPRRHFAVGIEMQDHLGAFARRPTRRSGHVEGVEPRLGDVQQPVGPRNVRWIARMAGIFVVRMPQPEFAVAPNLAAAPSTKAQAPPPVRRVRRPCVERSAPFDPRPAHPPGTAGSSPARHRVPAPSAPGAAPGPATRRSAKPPNAPASGCRSPPRRRRG